MLRANLIHRIVKSEGTGQPASHPIRSEVPRNKDILQKLKEIRRSFAETPKTGQRFVYGLAALAGATLYYMIYDTGRRKKSQTSTGKPNTSSASTSSSSSKIAPATTAKDTSYSHHVPGGELSTTSKLLDISASMTQKFGPLKSVHEHLCGFHFYAHDMARQVEAHHFCGHLNEDVRQCLIYDSDKSDARLIGIEYVISEKLFQSLPQEEKRYWHSHVYEVKSGELVMPGVPQTLVDQAEHKALQGLISTYGKTWHFWQVDRGDILPLGPPQLMMAFTEDGQSDPKIIYERDRRLGISTDEKKKQRADMISPQIVPGADHWKTGKAWQATMEEYNVHFVDKPKTIRVVNTKQKEK